MKKILLIALSVGLIACGGGESTQAEKQKETTITKTHSGCKIEEKKPFVIQMLRASIGYHQTAILII